MKWFNSSKLSNNKAVVTIHDQIGRNWWDDSGVTSKEFIDEVDDLGGVSTIELHINSPGGSVYDGIAIYNHLKNHKAYIDVVVDGEASSIASVIAMAGNRVTMPENALMMIHDPMRGLQGYYNAEEMRKVADQLDIVKKGIVSAYRAKTRLSDVELSTMLTEETYLDAATAKSKGFADVVSGQLSDKNFAAMINSNRATVAKAIGKNPPKLAAKPLNIADCYANFR